MTMEQKKTQLKEQTAYHPYYSKKHHAPPVGAREARSGGEGLYGRPPVPPEGISAPVEASLPVMASLPVGAREAGTGGGRHPGDDVQALYGRPPGGQVRPLLPRTRVRVVTMPEQPVRPTPSYVLAERRQRLRGRHGKPAAYTVMVQRSLSQTDVTPSNGRMRAIRPEQFQPRHNDSHIPVRSGRRRRRGAFVAKLLGFFAVLVIAVLGANFALTSPALRVQQVSVEGTQNPIVIGSIQHMGVQGQNIFLIDTAALAARIEALPQVASATLAKQWPNALTVTVVERTTVLLWQTKYGTYSVDRLAVVIAPASQTLTAHSLQTLVDVRSRQVGLSNQPIGPGVRLSQADVAFALQVFASLPQVTGTFILRYDLGIPVGVATSGGNGSFIVVSPHGWIAYLGGASDANPLDNRLHELQQILLLAHQQHLNVATIDLRFGLRPVFTLK
jgi:hypothetical protein